MKMYNLNVADVTSLPILTYAMHLFSEYPPKDVRNINC